jgi:hypothetical protein
MQGQGIASEPAGAGCPLQKRPPETFRSSERFVSPGCRRGAAGSDAGIKANRGGHKSGIYLPGLAGADLTVDSISAERTAEMVTLTKKAALKSRAAF